MRTQFLRFLFTFFRVIRGLEIKVLERERSRSVFGWKNETRREWKKRHARLIWRETGSREETGLISTMRGNDWSVDVWRERCTCCARSGAIDSRQRADSPRASCSYVKEFGNKTHSLIRISNICRIYILPSNTAYLFWTKFSNGIRYILWLKLEI